MINVVASVLIGLMGITGARNALTPTLTIEEMKSVIETNAPGRATIVAKIDSYEDYIADPSIADSVLLNINSLGFCVDENNTPFASFNDAYTKYSESETLMNLQLNSKESYLFIFDYMLTHNLLFTDFNVFSNNNDVITLVKTLSASYRVGYDVTNLTNPDFNQVRRDSNSNGSHFIVASQNQVDYDVVESVQYLAKPVWVVANSDSVEDLAYCYGTGAFGVVTDNPITAINVLYELSKDGPTVFRSTLNIAHRGDSFNYGENSLEGFQALVGKGVNGFETDFHVTKDKQIIAMHDPTIDLTTNGSGKIAEMTLEQIKQYKIIINSFAEPVTPCTIPTLDEIFTFMQTNDLILFAEIKCSDPDFATIFKNKVDQYNMSDRIVIINFETLVFFVPTVGQLAACRKAMPEIWGLNLLWFDLLPDLTAAIESALRIGIDANLTVLGTIEEGYFDYMRDRGFLITGWSLVDDETWGLNIYKSIVYGFTNNYPTSYAKLPAKVDGGNIAIDIKKIPSLVGTNQVAKMTNYVGEVSEVEGKVYSINNYCGTAVAVIDGIHYVYNFTVNKAGLNLGLILGTSIPSAIILGLIITYGALKYKKKREINILGA